MLLLPRLDLSVRHSKGDYNSIIHWCTRIGQSTYDTGCNNASIEPII